MNPEWSDSQVVEEIGQRLRQERLNQNLTQARVAELAGVRRATISDIERGRDFTIGSFVSILRVLKRLENLDAFLPDPGVSPMQLLRERGNVRRRATGRLDSHAKVTPSTWSWGEKSGSG